MDKLFIDTEFNGFQGELISMAIVDDVGREFYEVLAVAITNDWVIKNVLPVLKKIPVSREQFQDKLYEFLSVYTQGFCLIADWPEDLKHFLDVIITGPGQMMNIASFEMRMTREIDSKQSAAPHNALYDAIAIRESYKAQSW